jgi:hypothetical protein
VDLQTSINEMVTEYCIQTLNMGKEGLSKLNNTLTQIEKASGANFSDKIFDAPL